MVVVCCTLDNKAKTEMEMDGRIDPPPTCLFSLFILGDKCAKFFCFYQFFLVFC
uniref:Uncharacterized protein n=1 Tax=Nelumbo nucifera TaxID=4432 RepID=A0A822ZX57_NELNU|nr:TPA_asm: hypothetical protein HUJ06_017746 [Nelumbo nucifera]